MQSTIIKRLKNLHERGAAMNGRTYCGHYKGHYLKSTLEYIYARYLDYMGITWDYEIQTFQLPFGSSYKPDFYLGDRYIEVKGGFNYELDLPRIKAFESQYGVTVEIVQERDIRRLIAQTPFVFEQLRQEWRTQALGLGMDTSGKNNPRYGIQLDQSTKDKIGAKTKARMQDPEYRAKWLAARQQSEKVQANIKARAEWAKARKLHKYVVCSICGKEFELLYRKSNPKIRFCSHKCSASKQKNLDALQLAAIDFAKENTDQILNCKLNKIKPVLHPFYKVAEKLTGIRDERTLVKALTGNATNRKDLLRYFQDLVEHVLRATANQEAVELEDKEPLG